MLNKIVSEAQMVLVACFRRYPPTSTAFAWVRKYLCSQRKLARELTRPLSEVAVYQWKKALNNRKDVQKSRSGMEDNPQVRKCSLFVPRMQNLPVVSPETLLLFTKKKNVDENALKHLIWKILLDTPTVLLQLSSKKRKLVELRENGSSYFQTVCFPACLH